MCVRQLTNQRNYLLHFRLIISIPAYLSSNLREFGCAHRVAALSCYAFNIQKSHPISTNTFNVRGRESDSIAIQQFWHSSLSSLTVLLGRWVRCDDNRMVRVLCSYFVLSVPDPDTLLTQYIHVDGEFFSSNFSFPYSHNIAITPPYQYRATNKTSINIPWL